MSRLRIGTVTEKEKKEIEKLYERKLALQEFILVLTNPELDDIEKNQLYEKVLADISQNKLAYEDWWHRTSQKYNWQGGETGQWRIDFKTNEIFLMGNNPCSC